MTIANLGIAVDSSPAARAAVDLDKLVVSSASADAAVTKLGTSSTAAFAKVGSGAGAISQQLRQAANDAESLAGRINRALNVRTDFGGGIGRGADIAAYGAELDKLRGKFNPLFTTITQYKAVQAEIRQAHSIGAISVNEMTAALDRERTAALASIAALRGRQSAMATARPSAGAGAGAFQTANIGAQFQDIAVTAAMGQSLGTIALQQGTQLAAVLNTMGGARGAIAGLASAFVSIINPVSLLTIGLVAGSAALIQYFMTWKSDAPTMEEALKRHAELIEKIQDQWPGATDALKRYSGESASVLEASARTNIATFQTLADEANKALLGAFGSGGTGTRRGLQVDDEFKAFSAPILELRNQIKAGNPDFAAFQQQISEIGRSDPTNLQKTADAILKAGNESFTADGKLKEAKATLSTIGGTAAAQLEGLNQFTAAMRELSGIGLPALDDQQKALHQYEIATNRATSREDKDSAFLNYQDALARLDEQTRLNNVPKPDDKPNRESIAPPRDTGAAKAASEATRAANAYRDLIKSVDDRIGQMELEAHLVGKTGVEADAYRLKLELLQKAEDKGRHASPAQVAEIESKVAAYQKLAEAAAKATLQADLQFERDQMFRSPTDQTIASTLKGAGLPIDFNSAEASAIRFNEQIKEARSLAGDFVNTFTQGLKNGETFFQSLGDAAISVLDTISQKLIDMALDQLFANAFGGSSGSSGGGGLLGALGSLFGGGGDASVDPWAGLRMANGGAFADGVHGFSNSIVNTPTMFKFAKGAGLMGEAGPEAIMPLRRDSSGRLGVSAGGTGGAAANSNQPQEVTLRVITEEGPMFRTMIRAESEDVSVKVVQANNKQRNDLYNGGGNPR